ncbi:MAG: GIY-YIG nuclease family protein, partial [Brevundimonas sp.]
LLAGVEVTATYKVFDVNPRQLEALIHKVFAPALLDLTLQDRFGNPVRPREWFLVPISAIDEAVQRIRDGSIVSFSYDPALGQLVQT